MSDLLQSGHHPDADQLNAFAEHALPDHERQQTLAHLAVCPDCRAIVALSLPSFEASAPERFRKSWFAGWNLAWPLVAAFAGLVLLFVHIHNVAIERRGADASRQVAISHPSPRPLQAPATPGVSNPKPPPVASEKKPPTDRRDEGAAGGAVSTSAKPAIAKPAIDAKSLEGFAVQNGKLSGFAQGGPSLQRFHGQSSPKDVTASGVGVAIMKTPPLGADHFEQTPTDSKAASTIEMGSRNEAQVVPAIHQQAPSPQSAPAVVSLAQALPVPVAPASATPKLSLGSGTTTQNVEVATAPVADLSTLNAEVAHPSIGNTISQLPSRLPILSTASNAHRILAIDTGNTVFFSDDDGTTWVVIPAQWRGRAVKVSVASSGSARTFATFGNRASPAPTKSPAVSSQPFAKSISGTALTGTVTDVTGAVIPDASLVIGNASTPNLRTVKTDRAGHYLIDDLVPGSYRVEVDALGFNKQQLDVTLVTSQQNLANFTLIVGSATETVSVEASAEPDVTLSVAKKKDAPRSSAIQPQAVFEMTTDTGDHWISTDGHTWKHQ